MTPLAQIQELLTQLPIEARESLALDILAKDFVAGLQETAEEMNDGRDPDDKVTAEQLYESMLDDSDNLDWNDKIVTRIEEHFRSAKPQA